ncbi:MAG: SPOR domain-containing protein [Tannerella sp.]|jgi:nucleoid DNA-binding protein|nr:SPOR domain-containing protein [Tannerella sp.]
MLEIATHIERLLLVNDCVIIPDFGGFVLQNHPAIYERNTHLFRPAHKEIVFNPTLKHDDGLIAGAYMQAYGMTFNRARVALKKDVEKLKAALEEQPEVRLDSIGSFRKEAEGAIVFRPAAADCSRFGLSSYGLTPFHMPPVPVMSSDGAQVAVRQRSVRKSGRVIYLPINRTLVYIAGVSAVAAALSMVIMTPVKDVNPASYTASFAPSEMVRKMIPVEALPAAGEESTVGQENISAETHVNPAATIPVGQENGMRSVKIYYVIIGSFDTENQARSYMDTLDPSSSRNVGIVRRNNHIRVYADKYDNRRDAEAHISRLRENKRFENAWLFVGR